LGIPQVSIVQHQVSRAEGEEGPLDGRFLGLISPELLGSPSRGILLGPSPYLSFLSRGLMGGLGDFLLFSTIGALASLDPLLFLFSSVHGIGACGGGSSWPGHYWHGWEGTHTRGEIRTVRS